MCPLGQLNLPKFLNNRLPQNSVFTPILFNVYTRNMAPRKSYKFVYIDDLALATQEASFSDIESTVNRDLNTLEDYFWKWRLKPNPHKTIVTAFHLDNRNAKRTLKVTFCNNTVRHDPTPTYLRVKLDHMLTFHDHLKKVATKTKTRVNLVQELASTSWGAKASVLWTSVVAPMYSIAK